MHKYDLGDPNGWPVVNGQQQFTQLSGLPPSSGGWVVVLNNSPYGLDAYTGSDPYRVDAGIGRLVRIEPGGYQLQFINMYAIPGANANDLRRVTLEVYEPDEEIREHYPIELIRNTNVLNTVNTGTNVGQVTQVVYDQSPINGEAANSVKSTAAAGPVGEGANAVDVTDANPTGGKRKFVMATGEADINSDGSVTAAHFHGTADGVPASGVTPGTFGGGGAFTFPAGDTVGFAGGVSFMDANTGAFNPPKGGKINGLTFITGAGSGTFNHGLTTTPVGIVVTPNTGVDSSYTIGVDHITSTTFHVNIGGDQAVAWAAIAFA